MKNILITVAIVLALAYQQGLFDRKVKHPGGVLMSAAPTQENLNNAATIRFKNYTVTPLADFDLSARVLSRENYRLGKESDLSPVDLALGWGPMSDSAVLEKITISQSNRWYHWQVDEFPIPRRDIEINSANMHMIPADAGVETVLNKVVKGDVIELRGKLVLITQPDGWHWRSSLTREDTGDGACEVVFVESLYIKH